MEVPTVFLHSRRVMQLKKVNKNLKLTGLYCNKWSWHTLIHDFGLEGRSQLED